VARLIDFLRRILIYFYLYLLLRTKQQKHIHTHTRTHTYNLIHCHSLLIDDTTHRPTLGSIRSWGMTKIRSTTKLYKTLLYSIYLFIYLLYEYSKRFVQPVVQSVNGLWRDVVARRLYILWIEYITSLCGWHWQDVADIIANLGSSEWLERRDGLASLQTLLRTDARLTSVHCSTLRCLE